MAWSIFTPLLMPMEKWQHPIGKRGPRVLNNDEQKDEWSPSGLLEVVGESLWLQETLPNRQLGKNLRGKHPPSQWEVTLKYERGRLMMQVVRKYKVISMPCSTYRA